MCAMTYIDENSSPEELTEAINARLSGQARKSFKLERSQIQRGIDLHGTIDGRPVRIEVRDVPGGGAYRKQIWVHDAETGEPIGRGNGADDLATAVSIYHWNEFK